MKKEFSLKKYFKSRYFYKSKFCLLKARSSLLLVPLQLRFIIIILITLVSCQKREFSVTPLPAQFGYIPPSDVGILKASGSNEMITMHWSSPPEANIVKIHILNLNDNSETILDGKATDAILINLSNYVLYNFVVKTENDKGLISQGATVYAIPFLPDVVKPSPVSNLLGFIINSGSAFTTWENPKDIDLGHIIVYLGSDSIVVPRTNNNTIIKGDIKNDIVVKAVDLSGNYSDVTTTKVSENMLSILGSDDGVNETITLALHPSVALFINNYKIQWGVNKSAVIPSSTLSYNIPLADMGWLVPVTVSLLNGNNDVTDYAFDHHHSLPGTIIAAYYDSFVGAVRIEGNMNNLGYVAAGQACTYNIIVNETALYGLSTYGSNPHTVTSGYQVLIDGALIGNGIVGISGNWSSYLPYAGPTMTLTKGTHSMTIKFLDAQANYQKFYFKKL